jgi:hypothetical protein
MNNRIYTKTLRNALEEALSPLGYQDCGQGRLIKREGEIVKVLWLQKGPESTKDSAEVTINVGIMLVPLAKVMGEYQEVPFPVMGTCQWFMRIGDLLPRWDDKWWMIDSFAAAEESAKEIVALTLKYAIPAMDALGSRENLRALWETGKNTGTSLQIVKEYLAVLPTLK